jgi:putative transposase
LKQKVSRALRGRRSKPERERETGDTEHFWQRRFYDFNVWSAKKVREKLDYMHANPVKRKLVPHPKDWPWSSWSYYENGEDGLIAIDTVGEEIQATSRNA